jgi:hypothetical protein
LGEILRGLLRERWRNEVEARFASENGNLKKERVLRQE